MRKNLGGKEDREPDGVIIITITIAATPINVGHHQDRPYNGESINPDKSTEILNEILYNTKYYER